MSLQHTWGRKASVGVIAAAMTMSIVAAPAASAGQTWGGNGYVDYAGFCYYNNRASPQYYTYFKGADLDARGRGVTCKAVALPVASRFPQVVVRNRSYTWRDICRMSGWSGVKSVSKNGTLVCK